MKHRTRIWSALLPKRDVIDQANIRAAHDGGRSYDKGRFTPVRTTEAPKMRQGSGAKAFGLGR